jgi:uncharacterized protein (TIGR02270 family)
MNTATNYQNNLNIAQDNKMNAYRDIYEQYVDNASFLWILRSVAINQPHYTKADIYELEQRIEAQLDGLMTSVEVAWEICLEALELEEPGEVFTSTIIAFRSHDATKVQKAIEAGLSSDETFKGLVSALGWLPDKFVHPWVKKFLSSKDLNHKYLALASCSVRRENPGEHLNRMLARDDCKQHTKLYTRALRLIGELRRQDLMPALEEAMEADDEDIKFWSNWSAILLGNFKAVENLEPYIFKTGPHQNNAINIAFRVLPIEQARVWISKLSNYKEQTHAILKATGILGDPHAVNWLILKMRESAISRLAAESFTMITGFDLKENNLIGELPAHLELQPNDEAGDADVSLDEYENLLWPDYEKVSAFWIHNGSNFIAGHRYFMGKSISQDTLNDKIINAFQCQRHAASMELALSSSGLPLQNTRARVVI